MKNSASSDFFERQDKARRATKLLVVWFTLGLLCTAAGIYAAISGMLAAFSSQEFAWDWEIAAWTLGGTILVVGGASVFKLMEMSNFSGAQIARELDGRKISPQTSVPAERQLLNIVQEMSLASGVPAPEVFVLQKESGINAFAAGTRIDNAAVAVSHGALTKLSRDELQAVIGHEFSHILNGDMRLNIKLCGWIFGLLVLSMLGMILLRVCEISGGSRSRNKEGNLVALLGGIGLALYFIGIIAQVFGQIIQAAISRQREHLADASSTQFTRNPLALANALSRIGGDSAGSKISAPNAPEFAHLFFASGIKSFFATHPPLEERIRKLNPAWDGRFLPPLKKQSFASETPEKNSAENANNVARGNVSAREIPQEIRTLAQSSSGAHALIILLMMSDNPQDDNAQAQHLMRTESRAFFDVLKRNWGSVAELAPKYRIPATQLAAETLRALPAREKTRIGKTLRELAGIDGRLTPFEQGLISTFCDIAGI